MPTTTGNIDGLIDEIYKDIEEKGESIKTETQVKYLLSKQSPLTKKQKDKLKQELKQGKVRVVKRKKNKK